MMSELLLVVTATYVASVGFGDVFDCQIVEVRSGSFSDTALSLTVLPSDAAYHELLTANPQPTRIELRLVMRAENEPYDVAPITGLVDSERRSWLVTGMRVLSDQP